MYDSNSSIIDAVCVINMVSSGFPFRSHLFVFNSPSSKSKVVLDRLKPMVSSSNCPVRREAWLIKLQPNNFKLEPTTVWSFSDRGSWATHSGTYRGNWSPYVPRNLLLRYSNSGDWVLDQFMGSGTTLVEAKLLSRNAVGVDINPQSVSYSETNLQFQCETNSKIFTRNGNATDLHFIKDNRIDFICTHPPYANIIKYSNGIEGDISLLGVDEFLAKMRQAAEESFRVLRRGKMCAVMMGDVRKYGKVIPLGFRMMECFLQAGFTNKEIIIKEQHNCSSTVYWEKQNNDFLLLAHEYIFVFQK